LISFILSTDFVDRNEDMQINVTRLSLLRNQQDNDSLSAYKILMYRGLSGYKIVIYYLVPIYLIGTLVF
jgi:hypothetical protein